MNIALTASLVALASVHAAAAAPPNQALVCPAETPILPAASYLRAVSLDLTGRPPTAAEYAEIEAAGEGADAIIDQIIDDMLASDDFAARVVRRHESLLWPNITNVDLTTPRAQLSVTNGIYSSKTRGAVFRGDAIECLDEPAHWDDSGAIVTTAYLNPLTGKPSNREGWVTVQPYWLAEGQTIKVCAFDAQEVATSPSGTECSSRDSLSDPGCGCGPNLMWCRGGDADQQTTRAFGEDLRRRVSAMIADDRPYLDLFTSTRAFVNGPIVDYLRHRAPGVSGNVRFDPMPLDLGSLPNLGFRDKDSWVEIALPKEHAGVLTSWAYLARFQTARARANRFYNAFLCQPFQPPAGGIPIDAAAASQPDLQKRSGCKYCHALLDPSASFWGRWTEPGTGYLSPVEYPAFSPACYACAKAGNCDKVCRDFYVITAAVPGQVPNLGKLYWSAFRRPEHEQNLEQGPRLLAFEGIADGRLPMCVARTTAEWLLGRQLADEEQPWAEQLSTDFALDGYSYKSLVRSIVTSDAYRRVR